MSPILAADSHDAAKLGCPRGCIKGGISYEDFTYFYQLVSTSHGGMVRPPHAAKWFLARPDSQFTPEEDSVISTFFISERLLM